MLTFLSHILAMCIESSCACHLSCLCGMSNEGVNACQNSHSSNLFLKSSFITPSASKTFPKFLQDNHSCAQNDFHQKCISCHWFQCERCRSSSGVHCPLIILALLGVFLTLLRLMDMTGSQMQYLLRLLDIVELSWLPMLLTWMLQSGYISQNLSQSAVMAFELVIVGTKWNDIFDQVH